MAGFVFSPTPDNAGLRRFGHDLLPATLGESLSATFNDPQLSPLELLKTQSEINLAAADDTPADRRRREFVHARDRMHQIPTIDPIEIAPFQREKTKLLSAEEANEKFGHTGAKFDAPIREKAAELIAKGKRAEAIRKDTIARGPQGVGPFAAKIGVSLAAAAIDPLNVVSALVPVIGAARMAGMVARQGVTRARLARGAIEGAVGNALIEPIVGGLSAAQQLDYGMSDALVNIALGGLLGGGLHVTGGKISDVVQARSAASREEALRSAVAQAAQGRRIAIEHVFKQDLRSSTSLTPRNAGDVRFPLPEKVEGDFSFLDPEKVFGGRTAPPARDFDLGPATGKGTGAKFADYTPLPEQDARHLEGFIQELRETDRGELIFREVDGQGGTPEVSGRKADTPDEFQEANRDAKEQAREAKKIRKANKTLPDDKKKPVPRVPAILTRDKVEKVAEKMFAGAPLGRAEADVAEFLAGVARDRRTRNANEIVEFRADREIDIAARRAEDEASVKAIADREASFESDLTADFAAADRAQRYLDESPAESDAAQLEVEFHTEQVDALRRAGLLDAAMEKQIKEVDDLLPRAESFGDGARAAAICMGRQ